MRLLPFLGCAAGLSVQAQTAARASVGRCETLVPPPPTQLAGRRSFEGVLEGLHADPSSSILSKVLPRVPELTRWEAWYEHPRTLSNGHVHTIAAARLRATRACRYHRQLLPTADGGTLAFDLLAGIRRCSGLPSTESWEEQCDSRTQFVHTPPTLEPTRPFLLLVSGLGGGSQDTYVRAMAVAAAERGWQVGVLNMRGCGNSPVTSPRFFSAFRGSTDDLRVAVQHVHAMLANATTVADHASSGGAGSAGTAEPAAEGAVVRGSATVALLGWSNGGTIVNNYCAELATTHDAPAYRIDAAAALACPLNMPEGSKRLERPFQRAVYDRAIAGSLAEKFRGCRGLFVDGNGAARSVPQWEGLPNGGSGFIADVDGASRARTIREIDEYLTRRCFGFETVDEYYAHASSDQRLKFVRVPLLLLSAADDPIAPASGIPLEAPMENPQLMLAVTRYGGHLGWCDRGDPWGAPEWVQRAALGFLEAVLELPEPEMKCVVPGCEIFD